MTKKKKTGTSSVTNEVFKNNAKPREERKKKGKSIYRREVVVSVLCCNIERGAYNEAYFLAVLVSIEFECDIRYHRGVKNQDQHVANNENECDFA